MYILGKKDTCTITPCSILGKRILDILHFLCVCVGLFVCFCFSFFLVVFFVAVCFFGGLLVCFGFF